jgi:N-methylhydantoinase A
MSDVKHDHIRSRMTPLAKTTAEQISQVFNEMETGARAELEQEGFAADRIHIGRSLDLRYAGQGYELTVACGPLAAPGDLEALRATFDTQHKSMFGHMAPGEPVEIVSYRMQATGLVPPVPMGRFEATGMRPDDALRERRRVRFDGADLDTPVYQRERLDVGVSLAGPAVIDQFDCTVVVYPGQEVRVDEFKNLIVTEA